MSSLEGVNIKSGGPGPRKMSLKEILKVSLHSLLSQWREIS